MSDERLSFVRRFQVHFEVKTSLDFHGVDGISVYVGQRYKRADDCDCPVYFASVTAKAATEAEALDAVYLMAERFHAALGEFIHDRAADTTEAG